jgi:PqqD family protein of HPr-rel-A system
VVSDPGALVWRSWGDECVVFDSRSGDMHLLDAVGRAVLRALGEGPASRAQVAARVASSLGFALDPDWTRHVERLLGELDELGLIEPWAVDRPGPAPGPAR